MKERTIKAKEKTSFYSGEATITLKHGKKTYKVIKQHNTGTVELFTYMLRCMVGGSLPEKRPALLYLSTGEGSSSRPILSFPILYEGTTNITTGTSSASVSYTFLIPDTFLPESFSIDGFRINSLDSSGYDNGVYALVDFDAPVNIESNTNLYITWKVTISNLGTSIEEDIV